MEQSKSIIEENIEEEVESKISFKSLEVEERIEPEDVIEETPANGDSGDLKEITTIISIGLILMTVPDSQQKNRNSKGDVRPLALFHIEYKILPDTLSELSIADIVVYDNFARIYIEKLEPKTCKLYELNNVTWISWDQKFTVTIPDAILMRVFEHKVEFLLWDNKDKASPRAKHDRGRNFKYDYEEEDIKAIVDKQHEQLLYIERSNIENVSYIYEMSVPGPRMVDKQMPDSNMPSVTSLSSGISERKGSPKEKLIKKKDAEKRTGPIAKIIFKMCHFFSDTLLITKHLLRNPPGLIDLVVSIKVPEGLLTTEQKKMFNPMTINIHSVNSMPGKNTSEGITFDQLKEICRSAYVSYEFFKSPPYKTIAKLQAPDIFFDDMNVILVGLLDKMQLKEYLYGPGLKFQIHDRDRNVMLNEKQTLLFGDDFNDRRYNRINFLNNKKKKEQSAVKCKDISGYCYLDLMEFSRGSKHLYRELSILHHRAAGTTSPINRERLALTCTPKYIECNAILKVTLKLAYPLFENVEKVVYHVSPQCPFSRVVFKINGHKEKYARKILRMIAKINAKAVGLDNIPEHTYISILSTLLLTPQQKADNQLDTITGIHFINEDLHLLIIEGIAGRGLSKLIREFQDINIPGLRIYFKSDYYCAERLYSEFNLTIMKIKLKMPLEKILIQPLLYVRGTVDQPCFEALMRFSQLVKCKSLMDAVHHEYFPNAKMVSSLVETFTTLVPDNFRAEDIFHRVSKTSKESVEEVPSSNANITETNEVTTSGKEADETKLHQCNDFIKNNAEKVRIQSEKVKKNAVPLKTVELPSLPNEIQNYSICTLNSITLARSVLVKALDKNTLYTYNPKFHHSGTFPHVAEDPLKRIKSSRKIVQSWKLTPIRLCPNKLEVIPQPYEEYAPPKRDKKNCDRNNFYSWADRKYDFNLWKSPPKTYK